MKLAIPAVMAMAATTVAGEYFTSYTRCGWTWCNSDGVWHGDDGDHDFDANEGCRDRGLPSGLTRICIDWGNKRAHAYSSRYPKRCYRKTGDYQCNFHNSPDRTCANWDESPCDW
ncbi:hypothetical protein NLG97_g1407 [Lecanicillium saksenae]|uniref:Uncharacterized protein n=1 Tax=Lecanicillium saksenae TaxID=468837 RepID=A0ACC1R5R6_9HYPO|nr:hypothetical protein NLG97_g1407 [Lecanicillium saksenae]